MRNVETEEKVCLRKYFSHHRNDSKLTFLCERNFKGSVKRVNIVRAGCLQLRIFAQKSLVRPCGRNLLRVSDQNPCGLIPRHGEVRKSTRQTCKALACQFLEEICVINDFVSKFILRYFSNVKPRIDLSFSSGT